MPSLKQRLRMIRLRLPRRRRYGGRSRIWPLLLILFGSFLLLMYLRLTPTVKSMAMSASKNVVTSAVNNAIAAKLDSGDLDYYKLIQLEKNTDGQVTALVCDMARINLLKTLITQEIITGLTEKNYANIGIPIGNLIGGSLLSGKGPRIPIRIIAVSSASTDFKNLFSTSGINQTRHRIVITVKVEISVLIPGSVTQEEVTTSLTVAETVVVGTVPDSYTYFEGSEEWDESIERFDIMT
ncbi:MAG: sporulation protein YunB [Clostridiales bacterium]|nr:sporulation protein YunB [Clostridiales bacterium]